MGITKMSLANIQGKLSRSEMKKIMAGSSGSACSTGPCSYYESGTGTVSGTCETNSNDDCVCKSAHSSIVANGPDGCGQ